MQHRFVREYANLNRGLGGEQKVRDMEQEKIDAIEQLKRKLHDERMGENFHASRQLLCHVILCPSAGVDMILT